MLHVVPTASLDAEDRRIPHVSPFDLPLHLPMERRTIRETVGAILDAVTEVSDTPVSFGLVKIRPFERQTVELGSGGRTARELLAGIIQVEDLRTSWLMHYDPGLETYFFSVYPVRPPTMPADP
jgi:hypothetical protein